MGGQPNFEWATFCSVLEFGPVPTSPTPLLQGAPATCNILHISVVSSFISLYLVISVISRYIRTGYREISCPEEGSAQTSTYRARLKDEQSILRYMYDNKTLKIVRDSISVARRRRNIFDIPFRRDAGPAAHGARPCAIRAIRASLAAARIALKAHFSRAPPSDGLHHSMCRALCAQR